MQKVRNDHEHFFDLSREQISNFDFQAGKFQV